MTKIDKNNRTSSQLSLISNDSCPALKKRSYYEYFTDEIMSIELQRCCIISLATTLYLLIGGLIFSIIEKPPSDETCSEAERMLKSTLTPIMDNIGSSYYAMISKVRWQDKTTIANDFFRKHKSDFVESFINDNVMSKDMFNDDFKKLTQVEGCPYNKVDPADPRCWNNLTEDNKEVVALLDMVMNKVQEADSNGLSVQFKNATVIVDCPSTWEFIDSLYFCATVITSIGYGSRAPSTRLGRVICIMYSLLGILLTNGLMALFADYLSNLHSRFKNLVCGSKFSCLSMFNCVQKNKKILINTFYGLSFFLVFMFIPSLLFKMIEKWTLFESIYFTWITVSTIGFGDLTPGLGNEPANNSAMKFIYYGFIISWMFTSLIVMNVILGKLSEVTADIFEFGMTNEERDEEDAKLREEKRVRDDELTDDLDQITLQRRGAIPDLENEANIGEMDMQKISKFLRLSSQKMTRPTSGIAVPGFGIARRNQTIRRRTVQQKKIVVNFRSQQDRLPAI